jgi:hypothetical protein
MKTKYLYLIIFSWILISCNSNTRKSRENLIKYKSIERSVSLLQNSTAQNPQNFSILFYGQSIVAGLRSDILVDSLRKVFPNVHFSMTNKAIGGFTAPSLIKTANHDVYNENPDLIIFHAYDDKGEIAFDSLIRTIRQRSSADIALFDHHLAWNVNPESLAAKNKRDSIQSEGIRQIATKYDCKYINVREAWKSYLDEAAIGPNILIGNTIDTDVHPNERGKKLLRDIILSSLLESMETSYSAERDSLREEISLEGTRKTKINFFGNRVEIAIDSIIDPNSQVEVLIDGNKPSSFKNSFFVTRPSIGFKSWMPALKLVQLGETRPRAEDWKIVITEMDRINKKFSYKVEGSITGFDGVGNSETDFISNTERIKINHKDFYLFRIEEIIGLQTPEDFEITFSVNALVEDVIQLKPGVNKYTVFRDFAVDEHSLSLKVIEGKRFPYKLIIYQPYLTFDE